MIFTNKPGLILKKTTKEDCQLILELIIDLAKYEGVENEVYATVQDLEKNIFDRELADAYLVEYQKQVIGFFIICPVFTTFAGNAYLYLDDLYIKEEYRHHGFGSEVLFQLGKMCLANDYAYLGWYTYEDNHNALKFYKDTLHATEHQELVRFKWYQEQIERFIKIME